MNQYNLNRFAKLNMVNREKNLRSNRFFQRPQEYIDYESENENPIHLILRRMHSME